MIKVLNCSNSKSLKNLTKFLELRRSVENKEVKIVSKILKDIKKNKYKALAKYENKFSNNSQIKISQKKNK